MVHQRPPFNGNRVVHGDATRRRDAPLPSTPADLRRACVERLGVEPRALWINGEVPVREDTFALLEEDDCVVVVPTPRTHAAAPRRVSWADSPPPKGDAKIDAMLKAARDASTSSEPATHLSTSSEAHDNLSTSSEARTAYTAKPLDPHGLRADIPPPPPKVTPQRPRFEARTMYQTQFTAHDVRDPRARVELAFEAKSAGARPAFDGTTTYGRYYAGEQPPAAAPPPRRIHLEPAVRLFE